MIKVLDYGLGNIKVFINAYNRIDVPVKAISDLKEIDRSKVYRRIEMNMTQRYDEIYPYITKGCLLEDHTIPDDLQADMTKASPESFKPRFMEALEN